MNSDIRIKVDIFRNPKIILLSRRHGSDAVISLLKLWCFAATNKPDGNLSRYSEEMIEAASEWAGDQGVFYSSLCEIGFIDCLDDQKTLHDWSENQAWVTGSKARSESSRKKILLRWALEGLPKKKHDSFRDWFDNVYVYNTEDNTSSILAVYKKYSECNTPLLSSPLPSSPNQNKFGIGKNVSLSEEEIEKLKAKFPDYLERIDKLSLYIGSKGDKYKSHYLTILSWANKETPLSSAKECKSCHYYQNAARACWEEGRKECQSWKGKA